MKFILGTKEGMTQIFDDKGQVWPVTVISAGPNIVTQVKTEQTDGYNAIQFAYRQQKESRVGKALLGHFKKANQGAFAFTRELRLTDPAELKVGDVVMADSFQVGDPVAVAASSKSRGFQGVVKRHGFHGGPRSHGQKHSEREPGSIAGSGGRAGGRVAKGMRMAGRMGGERVTVKNLKVVAVDKDHNQLLVSGAVPGRRGTLIEIYG